MEKTLYIPIDTTIKNTVECEKLVKRGDTLILTIKVFINGILADLTGQSIDLILKKSDNTLIEKTIASVSNGVITATLDVQATNVAGQVSGEIQIYTSNTLASTNTFNFNVDTSLADDVLAKSQDDIEVLADIKNVINEGNDAIDKYKTNVEAIANTAEAVEALSGIKNYIDTNLSELESENAKALVNIQNEDSQNTQAVKNIADLTALNNAASTLKTGLESDIATGNTLKINLETDITNGTTLKSTLESDIATGNTLKNNLETYITTATNSKTALDASITNANTAKSALETDIATAQGNSFATEIQNARGTYTNLNARLDADETNIASNTNSIAAIKQNIALIANKDYCINGNFDMWQRGVSATNPVNGTYLADRFMLANGITGSSPNLTHSKQTLNGGELDNSNYYYRLTSDALGVLNSGDMYQLSHAIENGTRKLCGTGKQVTVSFFAKSSIANKKLGISGFQKYGSGGSPSASEYIIGGFVTLSSIWKKYQITLNLNTLVGKTFGTNNDDCLKIAFNYAYGSSFSQYVGDTVGELFGVGTIDISQIKIEIGAKATPYQPRHLEEEIALCQRYYQNLKSDLFYAPCSQANAVNANLLFPVPMRVIPTATYYSFNNNVGVISDSLNSSTEIAVTTSSVMNNMICQLVNSSALFTVGKVYNYRATLDAEIY
jgi:predicted  nucleic acid-binding Zn-ribbon protein